MFRSIVGSATAGWCVVLAGVSPAAAQEKQQKLFSYYDPTAPAATPERKAEAAKLAQKLWSSALSACEGSAIQTVDDRTMIELDQPKFTLVSMRIPPAAKEVGYEFRGVALATAERWRWATRGSRSPKWSAWDTGDTVTVRDDNLTLDRGNTVLRNVVLKFDIWMKDGVWGANAPISSVSYAIKPVNLTTLPDTAATSCLSKMAGA